MEAKLDNLEVNKLKKAKTVDEGTFGKLLDHKRISLNNPGVPVEPQKVKKAQNGRIYTKEEYTAAKTRFDNMLDAYKVLKKSNDATDSLKSESEKLADTARLYLIYKDDIEDILQIMDGLKLDAKTRTKYAEQLEFFERTLNNYKEAAQTDKEKMAKGETESSLLEDYADELRTLEGLETEKDAETEKEKKSVMDYEDAEIDSSTIQAVKEVDRYLVSNANGKRIDFVMDFLSHSLRERLYIYHLIEHNRRKQPDSSDISFALTAYKPNVKTIAYRMEGSGLKVWRHIPGHRCMHWGKISDGIQLLDTEQGEKNIRNSLAAFDIKKEKDEYRELDSQEKEKEKNYEQNFGEKKIAKEGQDRYDHILMDHYRSIVEEQATNIPELCEQLDQAKKKDNNGEEINQISERLKKSNAALNTAIDKFGIHASHYLVKNKNLSESTKDGFFKFIDAIKTVTDPVNGYVASYVIKSNLSLTAGMTMFKDGAWDASTIFSKFTGENTGFKDASLSSVNETLGTAITDIGYFANAKGIFDSLVYFMNKKSWTADDSLSTWDNWDKVVTGVAKADSLVTNVFKLSKLFIDASDTEKLASYSDALGTAMPILTGVSAGISMYKAFKVHKRSGQNKRATDIIKSQKLDYTVQDEKMYTTLRAVLYGYKNPYESEQDAILSPLVQKKLSEVKEIYSKLKAKRRHMSYRKNMLKLNDRLQTTQKYGAALDVITNTTGFIGSLLGGGIGAIGKIVSLPLDVISSIIMYKRKKGDKFKAVDNYLDLDTKMNRLRDRGVNVDRMALRRKLIAKLGFSGIDKFYHHVAAKYAQFIKLQVERREKGYMQLLESFGFKVTYDPNDDTKLLKPTAAAIQAKLL